MGIHFATDGWGYSPDFWRLARMDGTPEGGIVEPMAKRKPKSKPTWTDVRAKLGGFDRSTLMGLIQSLYAAHTGAVQENH